LGKQNDKAERRLWRKLYPAGAAGDWAHSGATKTPSEDATTIEIIEPKVRG
jgi:hypothetical protein